MTLPAFVCTPQHGARITVASCRRMYEEATSTASAAPGSAAAMKNAACRGCTVGKAHGAGELPARWSDGSPVVRLELGMHRAAPMVAPAQPAPPARPTPKPLVRRRPTAGPESENPIQPEEPMSTPKQITHDGITDTYEGWGRRIGMTGAAIAHRIKRGMSVADALTAPKATAAEAARARAVKAGGKSRQRLTKAPKAPKPPVVAPAVSEAAQAVQHALAELDPVELLRAVGWSPEVLGRAPRGRLVLIPDVEG